MKQRRKGAGCEKPQKLIIENEDQLETVVRDIVPVKEQSGVYCLFFRLDVFVVIQPDKKIPCWVFVDSYLESLSNKQVEKVFFVLDLIEHIDISRKFFKKLEATDDIWEINIQYGNNFSEFTQNNLHRQN